MKIKDVRFRDGVRMPAGIDAKAVEKRILQIARKKRDYPTAEDLLRDARLATSPLHKIVSWDDRKEAILYRLERFRLVLRSLRVTFEKPDGTEVPVRRFISPMNLNPDSDTEDESEDGRYVPIEQVTNDDALMALQIQVAVRELESWIERWAWIDELEQARKLVLKAKDSIAFVKKSESA